MRRRFFLTIFFTMFLATGAVSVVQYVFFSRERLKLIDEQVDVVTSSLLSSGIDDSELEEIGDVTAEALETEPRTILVSLYAPDTGALLYRNAHAKLLFGERTLATTERRFTDTSPEHTVRFVNLPLPGRRVLQVGLLLDLGQIEWRTLNQYVIAYALLILGVILLATSSLTLVLLRPLVTLAEYLKAIGLEIGSRTSLSTLPNSLTRAMKRRKPGTDEFSGLIAAAQGLAQRLERVFSLSRGSASQMAHELKTPLTIIKNSLEAIEKKVPPESRGALDALLKQADGEVEHLNRVITAFLEWSRTEHSPGPEALHAVKMEPLLKDIERRLAVVYGDRVDLTVSTGATVFCDPEHAEQMFRNLIDNALKYSAPGSRVTVLASDDLFDVSNDGAPLPESVVQRLGQPFNVGPDNANARATGLGLAWVSTICKLYGWEFTATREQSRNVMRVRLN